VALSVLFRYTRIVHTRSYIPGFMAMLVRPVLPFRHVFDMRGLFVDEYILEGAFKEGTPRLAFARWLERRLLASSDAVVVVSERFRRHVLEDPGLRGLVPPAAVHVIPNRAELGRFTPEVPGRRPGEDRPVTGVYIGSGAGWHRFDLAAQLMAGVMRERTDVRFIAAVYPDASRAREVAREAGVPDERSRFVTCDPEDVPGLLREADFGLMLIEPHVSKDVCAPIKFAEYLASGLPVVAGGGVGDARDWIPASKLGILIGLDDIPAAVGATLGFLSSDDFTSGAASRRALSFAHERLDMSQTLLEYERVYRRLEGR
jgi:glycosyltransferase involved in cell wall biosynthesis